MIFDASTQALEEFSAMWTELFAIYRQEVSQPQMKRAFNAMQGRSSEDLQTAIDAYSMEHSYLEQNPIPALIALMDKSNSEELRTQAIRIYGEILHNLGGSDLVIASRRGAYALKSAFGSLVALAKSPDNEFQNSKDQKVFVDAFCTVSEERLHDLQFVFKGSAPATDRPNVRFIGSYLKCMELARAYYDPIGYRPNYPDYPAERLRLERKARDMERAQREAQLREMTDAEWNDVISQIRSLVPGLPVPKLNKSA